MEPELLPRGLDERLHLVQFFDNRAELLVHRFSMVFGVLLKERSGWKPAAPQSPWIVTCGRARCATHRWSTTVPAARAALRSHPLAPTDAQRRSRGTLRFCVVVLEKYESVYALNECVERPRVDGHVVAVTVGAVG
ncbi:MAG: hypothetical protein AABO58_11170 [Acidobacteriota bacterium]